METLTVISKFWTRIWALLIDIVLLGIIGAVLMIFAEDFLVRLGDKGLLLGLLIALIYQTISNSRLGNGQTPGKRVMGIQVVDVNGDTIGLLKSFYRALILSAPYFMLNMSIPFLSDVVFIDIFKMAVLCSMLTGIVVLYIFNGLARQSLHDLLTGTYVVDVERIQVGNYEDSDTTLKVNKLALYIWGGITVLLIVFFAFQAIRYSPVSKETLSFYEEILKIDGVENVYIGESTTGDYRDKIWTCEITLQVRRVPAKDMDQDPMVKEAIRMVLYNVNGIDRYDNVKITLFKGFDIGIASHSSSIGVSQSPEAWKAALQGGN